MAFCDNLKAAAGQCIVQRGDSALAESPEATKYEHKEPNTPRGAAEPADKLTPGVAIDERGCKARFHGLASEELRSAADCAKDDAATNEPKRVKTVTIRPDLDPTWATPAGAYVQVSAQKSEAEAQSSYRAMQQKYPGMLGSREASIRRADLGQAGIWYRAQIGPFTTAEQATAFCDNLKAAGGQCMVHRNDVRTETVKPSERKAAEPRRATVERPRSEPTPAPRRTIVPATAPAARSISSSVSSKTTNGGNKCNTMQGRCAIYAGGSCTPSTGHWRYSCHGNLCTMRYNECISRALAGRSP
jgi:hypothetical protein